MIEPLCLSSRIESFRVKSVEESEQRRSMEGPGGTFNMGSVEQMWEKALGVSIVGDVMNLEEFLEENEMTLEEETSPRPIKTERPHVSFPSAMKLNLQEFSDMKPPQRPSIIMSSRGPVPSSVAASERGVGISSLYAESKRAKLEREKEELRARLEEEVPEEDLALATLPGAKFDPKERAFMMEELKPQPIIRKRKKIFVDDDSKDSSYWERREKNNIAAKRSREARRLKENQIALRVAYLEKENKSLTKEVEDSKFHQTKLNTEREILLMKLARVQQNHVS